MGCDDALLCILCFFFLDSRIRDAFICRQVCTFLVSVYVPCFLHMWLRDESGFVSRSRAIVKPNSQVNQSANQSIYEVRSRPRNVTLPPVCVCFFFVRRVCVCTQGHLCVHVRRCRKFCRPDVEPNRNGEPSGLQRAVLYFCDGQGMTMKTGAYINTACRSRCFPRCCKYSVALDPHALIVLNVLLHRVAGLNARRRKRILERAFDLEKTGFSS